MNSSSLAWLGDSLNFFDDAAHGYSIRIVSRTWSLVSNMSHQDFDRPLAEQDENLAWSQPRPWAPWFTGWWAHAYRSDTWAEPDTITVEDSPSKTEEKKDGQDAKTEKGPAEVKMEEGGPVKTEDSGTCAEIGLKEGGRGQSRSRSRTKRDSKR